MRARNNQNPLPLPNMTTFAKKNSGKGLEEVMECSFNNAYYNILQFIKDCEIPMRLEQANCISEKGRYLFVIDAEDFDYKTEVEMPGLPLSKVRFVDKENQDPYDFTQLYVNGSSWLWKYATITKEEVIEVLERRKERLTDDINKVNSTIEKLRLKV